jgi:glycosyltransferase involved in cell wall biosynthesis
MSTYNNAAYLRDAVDSILNQTYRDFELIVINDGSKDNTEAILREYEQQDCRVRVVSRGNKGLTDSLNEGVDLARGRYVARMDADDIAYRDRFAVQMAYMAAHPECVCCGTFVRLVDPFGSSLGDLERPTTHEEIDEVLMTGSGWTMVHPTVLMRTEAVRRLGGYKRELDACEDLDLFIRLAEIGRVANLPTIQLDYRQHLGSINKNKLDRQIKLTDEVLAQANARRGTNVKATAYDNNVRKLSPFDQYRQWGWKALKLGNAGAAKLHAKKMIGLRPFDRRSWHLYAVALRGR